MCSRKWLGWIGIWGIVLACSAARAAPLGTGFTYQGQLKQGGIPVNDTCDFVFSLWDDPADSNVVHRLGTQPLPAVEVINGLFTVVLNESGQFGPDAFNGNARWLEIAVCCPPDDCTNPGNFTTLEPRQELTPVPYALFAAKGPGVDGGFWAPNGDDIYNTNAGNVGIGTSSPVAELHVDGSAVFRGPGPWVDVRAFGAKGDGVTDDTAAIQAAIDSLQGKCIDDTCVGGSQDGGTCDAHRDCPDSCPDDRSSICNTVTNPGLCEGGAAAGMPCQTNLNCQGTCNNETLLCEGGTSHGEACTVGMCNTGTLTCEGGVLAGFGCTPDRYCYAGGTVFFPPGKYYLTSSLGNPAIAVTSSGLALKGAGIASQLFNHGEGDLLQINGAHVKVDSLNFQGGRETGWSINARSAPDTRITNCNLSNASTSAGGISFNYSRSSTVTNCTLGSIEGTGIKAVNVSFGLWLSGNRIVGCESCGGVLGTGIFLGAGGAHVAGNEIGEHLVGIDLHNGGRGNVLSGNYFHGNKTDVKNGHTVVQGLVIEGGYFGPGRGSDCAIELTNAAGVTIRGNRFEGEHTSGAPIRITSGGVVNATLGPNDYQDSVQVAGTANESVTVYDADRETGRGRNGFGTMNPSNILTVRRDSSTDPIADAWTVYSSRRWKTSIEPLTEALEKVKRLRGVSFNWKESGKPDIGLIAEEVGRVVPEVVAYEENGADAKSIDYARLTALLIEAVKAQQVQIEALREQVTSLESPAGLGH